MNNDIALRPATPADAAALTPIIFRAFGGIAAQHNFPKDFPSVDHVAGLIGMFLGNPQVFGVVAERGGRVVGSNFLDGRDEIRGVGPITVDPDAQAGGVGRALMRAVLNRAEGAAGVRLVQDAFNTVSMSLYASLGFDAREPLALMSGTPRSAPTESDSTVRPMRDTDVDACAALCTEVHGFSRANEVRAAIGPFKPYVLVRGGRVAAYATSPTLWFLNHGVARAEGDLEQLLLGAAAAEQKPLSLLVPIRRASFFRWCLGQGLRVAKPMTLMTIGAYHEPNGAFYPSVSY